MVGHHQGSSKRKVRWNQCLDQETKNAPGKWTNHAYTGAGKTTKQSQE